MNRYCAEMIFGFLTWEQPILWTIFAPIGFQILKQFVRKDSVAVLFTFALLYPDQHSGRVTLYMMRFEVDQFIDP